MNTVPNMSHIPPRPYVPITTDSKSALNTRKTQGNSFVDILQKSLQDKEKLTFSKHAIDRMQSRAISFSDQQMQRLNEGVERAQAKGARESLMLMDDIAMIVSVDNKTVITCMEKGDLREHVFTNIDSAALV